MRFLDLADAVVTTAVTFDRSTAGTAPDLAAFVGMKLADKLVVTVWS